MGHCACVMFGFGSWFSEYCEKYAKPGEGSEDKSSDEELSEEEYGSDDDEDDDDDDVAIAGKPDP